MGGPQPRDPMSRYLEKIDRRGPDDCWEWTAGRFDRGYGAFRVGDKQMKAHRFGYQMQVGPIAPGLYVLHRCDNPPCQNPAHWFLGTHKDNAIDREQKGRRRITRGEDASWAKLSDADVRSIRARYAAGGIFQHELAAEYGINQTHVSAITRGKRWSHLV